MNRVQTVAKNTIVRSVSQVLCILLSAFFLMYITRKLGSADFGKYTLALSLAGMLMIIAEMGIHTLLTKKIAQQSDDTAIVYGNILFLKFILTILFFISLIIAVNLLNYNRDVTNMVYSMGAFVIITSIFDLINSVFRGYEKMEYEAAIMFLNRSMVVGSGFYALYMGWGLQTFVIAIVIGNSLSLIPGIVISLKIFLKPRMIIHFHIMRNILKEAFPIGIMLLLTTVIFKAGVVLLSIFKDYSAVGWYGAPLKFLESALVFPTIFAGALLPVFTSLYKSMEDSIVVWFKSCIRLLVITGLPVAVFITVLSDKIVLILFGGNFSNSVIVLQLLTWAILFNVISNILSHILIAIDKQQLNMISYGISAIVTIGSSIILIPLFSYNGAAISLLIGQVLLFITSFYFTKQTFLRTSLLHLTGKPLASCLLMSISLYYMRDYNLLVSSLLGIGVYLGFLFITKEITDEDIVILRSIVKQR